MSENGDLLTPGPHEDTVERWLNAKDKVICEVVGALWPNVNNQKAEIKYLHTIKNDVEDDTNLAFDPLFAITHKPSYDATTINITLVDPLGWNVTQVWPQSSCTLRAFTASGNINASSNDVSGVATSVFQVFCSNFGKSQKSGETTYYYYREICDLKDGQILLKAHEGCTCEIHMQMGIILISSPRTDKFIVGKFKTDELERTLTAKNYFDPRYKIDWSIQSSSQIDGIFGVVTPIDDFCM